MKKMMFLFSMMMSLSVYSQEPAGSEALQNSSNVEPLTTESTVVAEPESTVETEPVEAVSEQASSIEYVDLLKVLYSNKNEKNAEEILWQLTDPEYKETKNNDFLYQKVKDDKLKLSKEMIEKAPNLKFALNVQLKVDSYDFKTESYPVQKVSFSQSSMIMSDDRDLAVSPVVIGAGRGSSELEKNGLPVVISLKVTNVSTIKTLKIPKDAAEKLSSNLGMNREVACVMELSEPVLKKEVKKYGKMSNIEINGTAKSQKLRCYFDDMRTSKLVEL